MSIVEYHQCLVLLQISGLVSYTWLTKHWEVWVLSHRVGLKQNYSLIDYSHKFCVTIALANREDRDLQLDGCKSFSFSSCRVSYTQRHQTVLLKALFIHQLDFSMLLMFLSEHAKSTIKSISPSVRSMCPPLDSSLQIVG